ncbi:hypothetical protein HK097_007234 [Rhizophlyctis rosea]|uniref:SF3 helicase domain-containing protein n=1 Tax=Rhizophlyctis rosea TaxID=64517 RepID=A0AAD5SEZ6_9FUNG|nr:hypothetical protein HK097_007234 [Rhizophlyctis rosea]
MESEFRNIDKILKSELKDLQERFAKASTEAEKEEVKKEMKDKEEEIEDNVKQHRHIVGNVKTPRFRESIFKDVMEQLEGVSRDVQFDATERWYLLAFKDGVYDLRTGPMRKTRPTDYVLKTTKYKFPVHNEEKSRKVKAILESIHPDPEEREFAMLQMASELEGRNTHEKFFVNSGSGRNGKGIEKDLCVAAFGEYCTTPMATLLTEKRGASSSPSPDLMDLVGARVVFVSEPENGQTIKTATLRFLTGNDRVRIRQMYGMQQTLEPIAKFFLLCNDLPLMDAPNTDAVWDRIVLVLFRIRFVDNPKHDFESKIDRSLKTILKDLGPQFMLELLAIYRKYFDGNVLRLDVPASIQKMCSSYEDLNNPLKKFTRVQLSIEPNCPVIPTTKLFNLFTGLWATDENLSVQMSLTAFVNEVKKQMPTAKKERKWVDGSNLMCYTNVYVRDYQLQDDRWIPMEDEISST